MANSPMTTMREYDQAGTAAHRKHYAAFAKLAYDRNSYVPPGYMLDESLSNRNRQVWVNHDDKRLVYAMRGTQPTSVHAAGDIGTDILLALNMRHFSSRFRNSVKTGKEAQRKYPDYQFTSVGHSLGGSSALHVAQHLKGTQAVTFAAHTPTTDIARQAIQNLAVKSPRQMGITNYTIAHDPVSTGTYLAGKSYNLKQTAKDPHALSNYFAD